MFELVEEAFDGIALFVEMLVIGQWRLSMPARRDDRLAALGVDLLAQVIGIVAFIGKDGLCLETINQVIAPGGVILLARAGYETDRQAQSVGSGMDFGAQSSPGTTKALGMRPPFFLRAPAAC